MTACRLLADIGGTNVRFALQAAGSGCADIEVLPCRDYDDIGAAMDAYLARAAARGLATDGIRHAAIAIANPVEGDCVSMTNHHWRFSIAALRAARRLETLLVVNDFAALAMALPHLDEAGRERIGGADATPAPGRPIGLIGPGTGLGVSGVVPAPGPGGTRWIALAGEGGHASFAPVTRQEMKILDALWDEHGHVSAERLLSGPGLEAIHGVLSGERLAAATITARALGATGGMYIGGGIVPRLGSLFHASAFRARFEGKGRLQPWLARIPTWLVTEPYPALRGVAAMLDAATLQP